MWIEIRGETRERERKRKKKYKTEARQRGIGTVRVDTRFDWGTKQAHGRRELRELMDGGFGFAGSVS